MRRTLIVLIVTLLFVSELPARSSNDWENVKKLKRGTAVAILLWSGENLRGRIDNVTDTRLNLDVMDHGNPQIGLEHELDRASIHRILTIRHLSLPDTNRWMLTGAAAGGGIGLAAGGIADITHGTNYKWLAGGFGGALFGFLVSCGALAAVGGVEAAHDRHHEKVVYVADAPAKSVRQQGDSHRMVGSEATSAREGLEQLQKHSGLALSFVDNQGRISILNFKKRDFVARSMEAGGYGGAIARAGNFAVLWDAEGPLSLAVVRLDGTTLKKILWGPRISDLLVGRQFSVDGGNTRTSTSRYGRGF